MSLVNIVVVIHRAWLVLAMIHVWGPQTSASVKKEEEVIEALGLPLLQLHTRVPGNLWAPHVNGEPPAPAQVQDRLS